MARRHVPPVVLQVEDIATGEVLDSLEEYTDDLGSGTHPIVAPKAKPSKGLPIESSEYARRRHLAKLVNSQQTLIKAGMGEKIGYKPAPKLKPLAAPGYRVAKTIKLGGVEVSVQMPLNAPNGIKRRM